MPMLIFKSIGNITNYLYRNICPSLSYSECFSILQAQQNVLVVMLEGSRQINNVVAVATCFFGISMINFTQQLKGRFERVEGTNSHWSGPQEKRDSSSFLYYLFLYFIRFLLSAMIIDSKITVKIKTKTTKKIYNTKQCWVCCFFCWLLCSIKCHKVIPHNVITWSFFSFSLVSWFSFERILRWMQRFLKLSSIALTYSLLLNRLFASIFSLSSLSTFNMIVCLSLKCLTSTQHMGYVRLNWTKELMKNHIFTDATPETSFDPVNVSFNRIFTSFFFWICVLFLLQYFYYGGFYRTLWAFSLMCIQSKMKHLEHSTRNSTGVCAFFYIFITFYENLLRFDKICFLFKI